MMNLPIWIDGNEDCDSSLVMAVAVAYDLQKADLGVAFALWSLCRNKRTLRMLTSVAKAMIDPMTIHNRRCI